MNWKEKWNNLLAKCKTIKNFEIIVAIVIIAVVILIYSSVGSLSSGATQKSTDSPQQSELESVLSCIEGAGEVRVLVNSEKVDGVECVRGVIVVAEGAEDVRVRMELVRAVRKALNVDANAIEIFAMK